MFIRLGGLSVSFLKTCHNILTDKEYMDMYVGDIVT